MEAVCTVFSISLILGIRVMFERTVISYPVALNSLLLGFVVVVLAVALFWRTFLDFLGI